MKLSRDENGTLPSYAWPGGYPIYYTFKDGGICCPDCANGKNGSEAKEGHDGSNEDDQWQIVSQDVHWEGEPMICDHCGKQIESAYGNPENE